MDPTPGRGEVVLAVKYAALNPADRYLAENQYPAKPPLPHILGRDGLGTIVSVGADAGPNKVGEQRIVLRSEIGVTRAGTLAEKVAVPIESLAHVPDGWSEEEASGAALVYLTAYQALTQWGELPPSIVLITGASGGVGVAAIQLAKALGHQSVALSRSEEKREQLKTLGADFAADPNDPNWTKQLKATLGDRRVDLAIDNIGGPLFNQVLETLGNHGRISVVGRLAGPVPQFNTASLFFRRLRIGGVAVGTYTPPESQAAWAKIVSLLARTGAKPAIDSVFPFDQVMGAFERLKEGPMGKVLVKVA